MTAPDKNFPNGEYADYVGVDFSDRVLRPENSGEGYDDIFKVSHCKNCTWTDVEVLAGLQRENALDLNRESCDNTFRRLRLDAGRACAILVKGGSSFNLWEDVEITRPGGHSDIYLGDYSEQSRAPSIGNTFRNIRRTDGKPVRVSWNLLRSDPPHMHGSMVRYQYLLSFFRTIYVEAKYLFTSWNQN